MKELYQYTIVAFVTSLGVTPFNTTYDRAKMEKKSAATRIQTHDVTYEERMSKH